MKFKTWMRLSQRPARTLPIGKFARSRSFRCTGTSPEATRGTFSAHPQHRDAMLVPVCGPATPALSFACARSLFVQRPRRSEAVDLVFVETRWYAGEHRLVHNIRTKQLSRSSPCVPANPTQSPKPNSNMSIQGALGVLGFR